MVVEVPRAFRACDFLREGGDDDDGGDMALWTFGGQGFWIAPQLLPWSQRGDWVCFGCNLCEERKMVGLAPQEFGIRIKIHPAAVTTCGDCHERTCVGHGTRP